MQKSFVTIGCAVLAGFPLQLVAQTIEQCIEAKAASERQVKTEQVISDQGCTTAGTEFVVGIDFTGYKVGSCRAEVCYPASEKRVITEATAQSHSAAGSNNGFDGPNYIPDRDRAHRVCFNVWARGPDKDLGARGWQKLNVTVTTQRVFSDKELIAMATTCAASAAKSNGQPASGAITPADAGRPKG